MKIEKSPNFSSPAITPDLFNKNCDLLKYVLTVVAKGALLMGMSVWSEDAPLIRMLSVVQLR